MRILSWLKLNHLSRERAGFVLGLLGVLGFSGTLPATRLAMPYLDPVLFGLGRSLVAGTISAILLILTRQAIPTKSQIKTLSIVSAGVIVGFPLLSALAIQHVAAGQGAVVLAVIPLFTAILGIMRAKQYPPITFWLAAVGGSMTVTFYVLLSSARTLPGVDALLLIGAAASAAIGYAEGGHLAKVLGGWQVICWALVLAAPFLILPVTMAIWRHGIIAPPQAWFGFLYVSIVSQLLAFFLWYGGLAMGGVVRISQVQLLQPFLTILAAAALLGERITSMTFLFATITVVLVALSRNAANNIHLKPTPSKAKEPTK